MSEQDRLRRYAALLVALTHLTVSAGARPARAAETAEEILARVRQLERGPRRWTDRTQKARMRIIDGAGKERLREIETVHKRYPDGEEKAVLFLLVPPELRGTGFLQWVHPGRESEQWLYLPQAGRLRQITSRLKDESFVGSDFSYRDMELLNEIARWTDKEAATHLDGEETIAGVAAYVIAYRPHDPQAIGYSALRTWVGKEDLNALTIEFQDGSGPVKLLELGEIRSVGGVPTPHRLVMRHLQESTRTVVEVTEVQYNRGLADDRFTQSALERGPQ